MKWWKRAFVCASLLVLVALWGLTDQIEVTVNGSTFSDTAWFWIGYAALMFVIYAPTRFTREA